MRTLSGGAAPAIDGFQYEPELISREEERDLLKDIQALTFRTVVLRGVEARRRVVQFGWDYEFGSRTVTPAEAVPSFLWRLRKRAGTVASVDPAQLEEVLVTEYQPGAGIGWHRDAPPFGVIVGVSLLSSCKFRLKRLGAAPGELVTLQLDPRSAYVISGEARTSWQHSIPPLKELRYSVTFRTIRGRRG